MDLFTHAEKANREKSLPLAARMRPKTLSEFVGQSHFLAPGKLLPRLIAARRVQSIIFYGPPGTGKTTLAHLLAIETGGQFRQINAVTSGIKVDGVVPTLSLAPPAAGAYVTGNILTFTVTTSEPVDVIGSPTLALTLGVNSRVATYNAGLSTAGSLVFEYLLTDGDSADGISIGAISLGLGSIKDAAGNNANTAVAAAGSGPLRRR